MKFALRSLLLFGLVGGGAARGRRRPPAPAAPRKAELGVYILDITDIDEPGGKFTLHVVLGTYWQDPERAFAGKESKIFREEAATEEVNTRWRPMVEFNRTTAPSDLHHALLRVHPDGRVEYERHFTAQIATDLDLRKLPFDTQYLKIELESFQHLATALELALPAENLRITSRISLPNGRPASCPARWPPSTGRFTARPTAARP